MTGILQGPPLPDSSARVTALTAHDRTLLVEAGAGSGKTALMAGRVALLVVAGVHPREIVAITFTEAAAAELLERIEHFVQELQAGGVPVELKAGLPEGLSGAQKAALEAGSAALDEVTCTTIHGFCQRLIGPYPVETSLDPGAGIIDPAAAELAYQDLMEAWLSARFGRDRGSEGLGRMPPVRDAGGEEDFFAELLAGAPDRTMDLIKNTAEFLKRHRSARAPRGQIDQAALGQFSGTVDEFAAWYNACPVDEPSTAAVIEDLARVAAVATAATEGPLTGQRIARILFHQAPSACKLNQREFKLLRAKTKWRTAAKAAGGSVALGEQLNAEAERLYAACADAYETFCGSIGRLAFQRFVREFETLHDIYVTYKRSAALLDFDDLLHHARDLLKDSPAVRAALAKRYPRVLVDEFQDTDPLQAEILWLLAGEGATSEPWHHHSIRPGALFLVGDPKQAIYRFRGADVQTYLLAKGSLAQRDPDAIIEINANFRTQEPILEFVNQHFRRMLGAEQGQPGFTPLGAMRPGGSGAGVAAFGIESSDGDGKAERAPTVEELRRQEASTVADIVRGMIGEYPVWDKSEKRFRPARPRDIALLAPTGTSLWIYERAMEQRGIAIATQAGKGFYRRQEVQDLIAVVRVIANHRDTLALGCLIRGPLVGLTEEQIADQIDGMRTADERETRLTIWTDPALIRNAVLRQALTVLQNLARKARRTTPYLLLAEAIDELNIRAILKARHPRGAERALANVELVLETARAYAGRGVGDFARAMWQRWDDGDAQSEGRPDAASDAVSITTIHAAKGLEWPIVIPINSATSPWSDRNFLYRRRDDSVHFKVFDYPSPEHEAVLQEEEQEVRKERVRLWYVALTRARDLLLLPKQEQRKAGDWFSLLDIDVDALPLFDAAQLRGSPPKGTTESPNGQDFAQWKREAAAITANQWLIDWRQPSRHEGPLEVPEPSEEVSVGEDAIPRVVPEVAEPRPIRGGRERGSILHKLMEEVLTGETAEDTPNLQERAAELIAQLGLRNTADPKDGPSSAEMAETIERTLQIPAVAELRPRLIPEYWLYSGRVDGHSVSLTSGIADAVAVDESGSIDVVVDWKSDVDPDVAQITLYCEQVRDYLQATDACRGILVFLSAGRVEEVTAGT